MNSTGSQNNTLSSNGTYGNFVSLPSGSGACDLSRATKYDDGRIPCRDWSAALELDHAFGFSPNPNSLVFCGVSNDVLSGGSPSAPGGGKLVAYGCGKVTVLHNLDDQSSQEIIRGHETPVTTLDYTTTVYPPTDDFVGTAAGTDARIPLNKTLHMLVTGHTVSSDGITYLNLWDVTNGTALKSIKTHHKERIVAVKFSPDAMLVATTGSQGDIGIFECAGGSRIASYSDTISGDQANAVLWGGSSGSCTRNQRYTLFVPMDTGVRIFTLTFSIRTLLYELDSLTCKVPGGGGRLGGMQRKFLCCVSIGEDLLCGSSSGEVLIFNNKTGILLNCITICGNGVTAICAAPAMEGPTNSTNVYNVFIGGGDGAVKKIVGAGAKWEIYGEVWPLDKAGGRVISMAVDNALVSPVADPNLITSSSARSQTEIVDRELVITTASGKLFRIFTSDLTYSVAYEGPMGYVSCITLPRNKSWNGEETSAACDEITTCSKDGLIRVWNLNDYSVKGYFCLSKTPVTTITDTADHLTSRQQAHNMRQTNGLIPHYHINSNKPSGARVSNAYHDSTYTVHSSLTYPTPICVCYAANTQYSRADESIILSGWSDGKVRAVRCAPSSLSLGAGTMTMLWSLDCHNGSVTAIDCCSLYMVTGGMDSVVRIWSYGDVNDPSLQRQLITQLQDHTKPITGVRIDNTVQTILHTISADTTHKVYDLQQVSNSSQAIGLGRNNSAGSINPPRCVRTHDGSAEFSSKLKQHILLSSSDQRITNSAGFLCMVQRVDGEREVSIGCGDGRILFYDVDVAQRPIAVLEDRLGAAVCSMDIVSASVVFQSLKDKADSIDSKKFINIRGGSFFATGMGDGSVVVYHVSNGQLAKDLTKHCAASVGGFVSSTQHDDSRRNPYLQQTNRNNNYSYSTNDSKNQSVPVTHSFTHLYHAFCHTSAVLECKWSKDGKQLFTASADGEFFIWNFYNSFSQ